MLANSCRAVVRRAAGQIHNTCANLVGSSRSTSTSSIALKGLNVWPASGRMMVPLNGASLAVDARRAYATGEETEEAVGEAVGAAAGVATIPDVSPKKMARSKPSGKAKTATKSEPRAKKGRLGRPPSKSSTARGSTKAMAKTKTTKTVATKAKKKPKETMTPEDQRKEKIRALVKLALKPPYGNYPQTAWTMFLGERMRNSDQPSAPQRLSAVESSRMYQNLSPAEMEVGPRPAIDLPSSTSGFDARRSADVVAALQSPGQSGNLASVGRQTGVDPPTQSSGDPSGQRRSPRAGSAMPGEVQDAKLDPRRSISGPDPVGLPPVLS